MRRNIFPTLAIFLSAIVFSTAAMAQQRFTASITAPQEVPVRPSTGTGRATVILNAAENQITVNGTYTGTTSNVVSGHIHDAGPVGVNGPIRFNFNLTGATNGSFGPLTFAVTAAQVADLRSGKWYVNIHTSNFTGGEIRGQVKMAQVQYDYDGDGRTNIAVFRQSTNSVYTQDGLNNGNIFTNLFGSGTGDNWLPTGDFDGDGRGDLVLVKLNQTSGDAFHSILQSGSNTVRTIQWGNFITANAERLAYGDYDGDGKQDVAVFRSGTGVWYIFESSTNTGRTVSNFGAAGDAPAVGDFDKDGKTDLCVVRNVGGQLVWYILNSSNGQMRAIPFGAATTDSFFFFYQLDYDGDGAQDIAVSRSENGNRVYYILQSSNNQVVALQWGLAADTRLVGDYDGDGKTDFVARRIENGLLTWYIYQSSTQTGRAVVFGSSTDTRFPELPGIPVSSDEVSGF